MHQSHPQAGASIAQNEEVRDRSQQQAALIWINIWRRTLSQVVTCSGERPRDTKRLQRPTLRKTTTMTSFVRMICGALLGREPIKLPS
jgi:hypothetical protein